MPEVLALVISRFELDVSLIPPLKLILPLLSNLAPLRLFTTFNTQIVPSTHRSLYDSLVQHLQQDSGVCDLTKTLSNVLEVMQEAQEPSFRVCLLGNETPEWGVVMELKRRGVVIDTANTGSRNPLLVQISYITGGIHRSIRENSMIKAFQTDFMLSTKSRPLFKIDRKEKVDFSIECAGCGPSKEATIMKDFFACSVCLAPYCDLHQKIHSCTVCHESFD